MGYESSSLDKVVSEIKEETRKTQVEEPVVLLEMGFLSNPEDEAYLINKNNHGKIVEGIGQGIAKCFV